MKKINTLVIVVLTLLITSLQGGCVVVSSEAVFESSSNFDIPNISGAFRTGQDQDESIYLLNRVEGFTNTFNFMAPDKTVLTLIFEPLNTTGRYVVQVSNPNSPEVIFGICTMPREGVVDIYGLNPNLMPELAQKYEIILNNKGHMASKPSLKNLKNFLDAAFDPQYSTKLDTIAPGRSEK